jgi:hypothetical protein
MIVSRLDEVKRMMLMILLPRIEEERQEIKKERVNLLLVFVRLKDSRVRRQEDESDSIRCMSDATA